MKKEIILNEGEEKELLFKINCLLLKDKKKKLNHIGAIKFLGDDKAYRVDINKINLNLLEKNKKELKFFCDTNNISKSKSSYKGDLKINDLWYSLKYVGAAPPAIINHTNRLGFLKISKLLNLDISYLDNIIKNYWTLRKKNEIKEDIKNSSIISPFKDHLEILKPYINYFCFDGTGRAKSARHADRILEFDNYRDPNNWKIFDKDNYINNIWDKLIFSIRSKGMPKNYLKNKDRDDIALWTQKFQDKYRGALHVRIK